MTKRTVEETLRQELALAQKAVTATSAAVTRAVEEVRKSDAARYEAEVRQDAAHDRVARMKAALGALLIDEHVEPAEDDEPADDDTADAGDPVPA